MVCLQKEAEDGCALELTETGKPGPKCARLQQLEQLTYELIGAGEVGALATSCVVHLELQGASWDGMFPDGIRRGRAAQH